MLNCMYCTAEFEPKQKFCGNKCRITYFRAAQVGAQIPAEENPPVVASDKRLYTLKEMGEAIVDALKVQKEQFEAEKLSMKPASPAGVNVSGALEPVISYE